MGVHPCKNTLTYSFTEGHFRIANPSTSMFFEPRIDPGVWSEVVMLLTTPTMQPILRLDFVNENKFNRIQALIVLNGSQ